MKIENEVTGEIYDYNFRQKSNNIYFETAKQVKAFIEMYDKEIKKIMGVI